MGFFDGLGKKVSETYKSAEKATGKLVEEGKLKLAISDNEALMKEIYETIGREYCETYFRGEMLDNGKFEKEYEELKKMQLENAQAREKLLMLKGIRVCANCGKEISTSSNFCHFCGMKQPEIEEPVVEAEAENVEEVKEEPQERVCRNCQNKLADDDEYCPNCGVKVE